MSAVGCYSLDLYCDRWYGARDEIHGWGTHFPVQYTHEYGSACRAQARRDGWIIRGVDAICPKCVAAGHRAIDGGAT